MTLKNYFEEIHSNEIVVWKSENQNRPRKPKYVVWGWYDMDMGYEEFLKNQDTTHPCYINKILIYIYIT